MLSHEAHARRLAGLSAAEGAAWHSVIQRVEKKRTKAHEKIMLMCVQQATRSKMVFNQFRRRA